MKYRLKSKTCTRRHKNKNTEKNDNQFIEFSQHCPLRTVEIAFQVIKISIFLGKNPYIP